MNDLRQRLQDWGDERIEAFFDQPWEDRTPGSKIAAGVAALTYLTTREVIRDRGPMMAAGLAFFTVLAIVPLLTVGASLMAAFGLMEGEGGRIFDTLHQLFPDVASGLASYLSDVATDSAQAVGGIGAATLLIIGLVLFKYIEETFTAIWRGDNDRPVVLKMLTFWAVISFGPVLIALSIVQTARAQIFLAEMGLNVPLLARMAPVLYALVAFALLFKLVPNAEVKWRSALVGGLFTAVVFELAKWGFNVYVTQLLLQTYDRVYGALALIPIGLIWVYITWLVILIGAELSYSIQNMRSLLRAEAGRRSSTARPGQLRTLHPLVPVELVGIVYQAFERGEGPVSKRRLIEESRLPPHLVDDVIDELVNRGLLVGADGDEKGPAYVPGMSEQNVRIPEVVEAFWVDLETPQDRALGELSKRYLDNSREFFEDVALTESADAESD